MEAEGLVRQLGDSCLLRRSCFLLRRFYHIRGWIVAQMINIKRQLSRRLAGVLLAAAWELIDRAEGMSDAEGSTDSAGVSRARRLALAILNGRINRLGLVVGEVLDILVA